MRCKLKIGGFLLPILLFMAQSANGVMVTITPDSQTVTAGEQVTVDVNVTDLSNQYVAAFDLIVDWDASLLVFSSFDYNIGALGDPGWFEAEVGDFPGVSAITVYGLSYLDFNTFGFNEFPTDQNGNTDFRLFSLTFDALATGTAALGLSGNITPDSDYLGDEWGSVIPISDVSGAQIEIASIEAVPEPGSLVLLGLGLAGLGIVRRRG